MSPFSNSFSELLSAHAADIDRVLAELLDFQVLNGELARPKRLIEAVRYSALGAGKRIRPFLLIETAKLFGVSSAGVLRAAAALEMIHCYSLIHDDLPAMDNDDLRRGKPTSHRAFDEATAILAGDALLTYAFDVLADEKTSLNASLRANLVLGLARASGLGGMVGGQMLDLQAESSPEPLSLAEIEQLQAMKTGALLVYAVDAGAMLGGCDEISRQKLREFARKLGVAFQIADDILDHTGDAALIGKKVGKDAERNKATFVSILGLEAAQMLNQRLVSEAKQALAGVSCAGDKAALMDVVDFIVSRES